MESPPVGRPFAEHGLRAGRGLRHRWQASRDLWPKQQARLVMRHHTDPSLARPHANQPCLNQPPHHSPMGTVDTLVNMNVMDSLCQWPTCVITRA
eukprot:364747-Chlamydomonas_euryale.AAC.10